jgi:hypothetical protein
MLTEVSILLFRMKSELQKSHFASSRSGFFIIINLLKYISYILDLQHIKSATSLALHFGEGRGEAFTIFLYPIYAIDLAPLENLLAVRK